MLKAKVVPDIPVKKRKSEKELYREELKVTLDNFIKGQIFKASKKFK
jgi:hypothetical protein